MNEKKQLTAKEVAQLLRTTQVTVLRWAYQGKIPCKLKDNMYVFKESEIIEWANAHDLFVKKADEKKPGPHKEDPISLRKAVQEGGFIYDLEGSDIYSVLKNAINKIELPEGIDKECVLNELLNREEIASTGIGKGVAIPHPRKILELNLEEPVIPVIFLKHPVDFNAVDGEEVFVLFMMLNPSTKIHLKLLSRLSLCLRDKEFWTLLKNKAGEEEILTGIERIESTLDGDPEK